MPLSFDELSATTFKNYRKTLADNIMKKIGLYAWLRKSGQIERKAGGLKIVEPLMYGLNNTFSTYSGYDMLNTTPQTGISAAEYDWKNAAVSVTISKDEEQKNKGESRIIPLLKSKITQAEKSMTLNLNKMLMQSDGTTYGNGVKDFTGLAGFVTTAASTIGGIAGATYPWWDNVRATSTVFATNGIAKMRNVFNLCCREGDQPKIMVTTQDVFEAYESQMTSIERINYSKGSELAGDLGFATLLFKGKPIIWDYYAQSLQMRFLNSDYLKLVIDSSDDFNMSEWRVPVNQMAKTAFLTLRGEMTCSNRLTQGILSISALV